MRFRMIDEQERIRPHIRIFINQREVQAPTKWAPAMKCT
jgi:hypothetical protein